jgi:hypothetical protein
LSASSASVPPIAYRLLHGVESDQKIDCLREQNGAPLVSYRSPRDGSSARRSSRFPVDAHVGTVSDHARNGLVIHPPKVKAVAITRTKLQSRFAPEIIAYQIGVTVSRLHNAFFSGSILRNNSPRQLN